LLPERIGNWIYFAAGLALHGLTSARHRLAGYTSPTGFPAADWERNIRHAEGIVDDYARHVGLFSQGAGLEGFDILELGPGATLATGALMLGRGARSYFAVDAVPLAARVPQAFYDRLADLQADAGAAERVRQATRQLASGAEGPLAYRVDPGFRVADAVQGRDFDLIVSNAAFEHFDDIGATIADLGRVARPGAIFLALVDFQTHTRWVRARDPNNIYRLPSAVYRALHFVGQPNRRRPKEYVTALEAAGWRRTEVVGVDVASPAYLSWSARGLAREFRRPDAQMEILTGAILAERAA
jgi:SAM-dependent methyltransferase